MLKRRTSCSTWIGGIQGIMGPHIASGEDAEKLVDACYFGPIGHRSFGGNRGTNYSFTPDAWGDKRDFYQAGQRQHDCRSPY